MAKPAQRRARGKRFTSPIGRKARRRATPNNYSRWNTSEVRMLRQLAKQNVPPRMIGRKLGRTEISVRGKAQREGISLAG